MDFYSPTNFHILRPWVIIFNFIRFDLGFLQPSKQFYRKLKHSKNVLKEFQRLPRFPRNIVLYLSTKFCILKPWAIISNFVRFDVGFWQTWKPFYRIFKYGEKVFEEFQPLPHFPRKMVLYSATYFRIFKTWGIISNFIRFNLGFLHAWKPFYRKLK